MLRGMSRMMDSKQRLETRSAMLTIAHRQLITLHLGSGSWASATYLHLSDGGCHVRQRHASGRGLKGGVFAPNDLEPVLKICTTGLNVSAMCELCMAEIEPRDCASHHLQSTRGINDGSDNVQSSPGGSAYWLGRLRIGHRTAANSGKSRAGEHEHKRDKQNARVIPGAALGTPKSNRRSRASKVTTWTPLRIRYAVSRAQD
jgi:hypothetical protein